MIGFRSAKRSEFETSTKVYVHASLAHHYIFNVKAANGYRIRSQSYSKQ